MTKVEGTIIERKSERKKKAIYYMVKAGEMSVAYALSEVERLNDEGKLLDKDYEELAEYLEGLLPVSVVEETPSEEIPTEVTDEYEEPNEEVDPIEIH